MSLNIIIDADVTTATNKIGKFVYTFKESFKEVERTVRRTSTSVKDSTDKMAESTNSFGKSSRNSLTALSLTLQDLPFGFIGIQNNLPGIIQGFGQMSAEAKTGASVMSQLKTALMGPAGIFLAFSAVTAGVTALTMKYGSLGEAMSALFGTSRQLSEEQKKIAEGVANEGTQALTLYSLYVNLSDSREKQIDIIKKLNQISPEYFGNLDAEKTKIDQLKGAIDKYIDSFIGKIYVETQQKKITELITKYAEKISFVIDKEIELDKQREKSANKNKNFVRDLELLSKTQQKAGDIGIGLPQIQVKQTTQEVIDNLRKQLRASVEEVFKGVNKFKQFINIDEIFGVKDGEKGKTPKAIEETAKSTLQTVKKFRQELEDIVTPKRLDKNAGPLNKNPLIEYQFGQIKAIIDALKEEAKFIDDAFRQPLENLFIDFLQKGKLSFEDFTKSVMRNITQLVAKLAASKLFEALANLIPQIAGTLVPGGTGLMELTNVLGRGRNIFGAANFGGMDGGGMNLNGQVVFVQRGADLVGVMNRANAQIQRIG
jgi:hypothetical protein